MAKKLIPLHVEEDDIVLLSGLIVSADKFMKAQKEQEGAVFAEDIARMRIIAKGLLVLGDVIATNASPELVGLMALLKTKSVGLQVDLEGHDCDTCEGAGTCPLESVVREYRAKGKGAGPSTTDTAETDPSIH
jgi:hypothetical protein